MNAQKWRDVWEETHAAMKQLEQSMEAVRGFERAVLIEQHANVRSDGVATTMELMRDSVQQMRMHVLAADIQLTAAVEMLIDESRLEELKKIRSVN